MYLSMLSPRGGDGGGDPGHMWGIWLFRRILVKIPTVRPQNLVKSDQMSPTFQHLIFWRKVNWDYQQSTQSSQSKVFRHLILRMSSEKKCFFIDIKTSTFQGFFSHVPSIPSWPAYRRAHWTMWLGPIPPCKKSKRSHPGTVKFLVKFLRVGKAIEVKCPTYARGPPPRSGLSLIHA